MNPADILQIAHQLRQCGMQAIELREAGTRLRIVAQAGPCGAAPADLPAQRSPDRPPVPADGDLTVVRSTALGVARLVHPAQPQAPRLAPGLRIAQAGPCLYLESRGLLHAIDAPHGGEVAELWVGDGDKVDYGRALFSLRAAP